MGIPRKRYESEKRSFIRQLTAFPLARKEQGTQFRPQSLDAGHVQLDYAYLRGADLKQVWMRWASLRKAFLSQADLSGADLSGADLSGAKLDGADLRKAILVGTHPELAQSLDETKMSGVVGLDNPEQRQACIDKGAIFANEDNT